MFLFIQKIIVIVLVLLQTASPLVHAHVNADVTDSGLHIPTLEALTIGAENNTISSLSGKLHLQNQVIGIGSVILKKHVDLELLASSVDFIIPVKPVSCPVQQNYCCIIPESLQPILSRFKRFNASRAPPATICNE